MALRYSPPQRFTDRGDRYYSRVYDPSTGRRTWVSCETDNKKAALVWVSTHQVEAAEGRDRVKAKRYAAMKFSEAVSLFLDEKREKVSARRHADLQTTALAFWETHFGNALLRDIDREGIDEYLRRRKAAEIISPYSRRKAPRPPSAVTLNNDLADLKTLFRFARRAGWIREDPAEGIAKFSGEVKRRRRYLAPEEEAALVRECRASVSMIISAKRNIGGPHGGAVTAEPVEWAQEIPGAELLAPYVVVSMRCGFRRRTLCGLEWRHLSFEAAQWNIPGELLKVPEDYCAPCPRDVIQELRTYRTRLLERQGSQRVAPEARIFGLNDESSIRRLFKHAAARAGLPNLTMHDLRRHYLNSLRKAGVPLETAMVLTAHRSLKAVRDHYLEIPQEELRAAVEALERSRRPGVRGVRRTRKPRRMG